jgi:hypothetical protein
MTNKSSDSSDPTIDWESSQVAEQWSRNQALRDESIGPATEMVLDLAGLENGQRVLGAINFLEVVVFNILKVRI